MSAAQLYCQGVCGSSWIDHTPNCQSTDADAFCKLKLCDEDAYAISHKVGIAKFNPGFTCDKQAKNFGDWLGMNNVRFSENVKNEYFTGSAVLNVTCHAKGLYIICINNKESIVANYSNKISCLNFGLFKF